MNIRILLPNIFISILFLVSLSSSADEVSQSGGFGFDLLGWTQIFKGADDLEAQTYQEGSCLGFFASDCFRVINDSKGRMKVTRTKDTLQIDFNSTPIGTTPEKPRVQPPRLLPLVQIFSKQSQNPVFGGLTELIPDSGIFAVSMHVLQKFGLAKLMTQRKSNLPISFFIFETLQTPSGSHPDIVFFSTNPKAGEIIKTYIERLQTAPINLGPEQKWISWYFANTDKTDESRFSEGVLQRKSIDNQFYIFNLADMNKGIKNMTYASSGALIQHASNGTFFAIVQCMNRTKEDVYALNFAQLDPQALRSIERQDLEDLLQQFQMPLPSGLNPDDCVPLGGGEGDRRGGGGSYVDSAEEP